MRICCRGPGNLTRALGITLTDNLLDLTSSRLRIEDRGHRCGRVSWGPRIGIRVGVEHPWRCWIAGHPRFWPSQPAAGMTGPSARAKPANIEFFTATTQSMGKTLLQKVWDLHTVRTLPTGQTQLFIGLHLIHEVTTPQAFDALRARGWKVARPDRTFATVDHIVPTRERTRPFLDVLAEDMIASLERNCRDFGIRFAGPGRRPPGDRARDRSGARAHAAGHDDRVRRQPHVDARRVRRGGVRHRHVAGPRRARLAVPGDGAAEGAAHPRHRHAARRRRTPRTSS